MAARRLPLGNGGIVAARDVATVAPVSAEPVARISAAPPQAEAGEQHGLELPQQLSYEAAKRLLDLAVAIIGIVVALPLMLVIAALIRLDSPGPVLFRQERLGKNAKSFSMLKFRTMYVNSGALPPELRQRNESTGPLFKMRQDPRITRAGRLLRRTSLDELPQLFNVLCGDMSLVGPRPPLPRELAGFDQVQRLRLRVAPGLTGLWQVSGRSDLPFEEMVRLDLRYIDERSLLLDLVILVKTVPSVLAGRGAY